MNDFGRTSNLAPTVTVMVEVLDGVMVLVVSVALIYYFYKVVSKIVQLEQKRSELYLLLKKQ